VQDENQAGSGGLTTECIVFISRDRFLIYCLETHDMYEEIEDLFYGPRIAD